jgi:predicted secreted hydrolase
VGWDWLGVRLADGRAVMLYRLRDAAGAAHHFFGGLVGRDGRVVSLDADRARLQPLRHWRSPRTGARYPVAWRVLLQPPGEAPLALDVDAVTDAQEWTTERSTGVTYWEGMVTGTAAQGGARTRLEGFLELTGYAGGGVPGRVSSGAPKGR